MNKIKIGDKVRLLQEVSKYDLAEIGISVPEDHKYVWNHDVKVIQASRYYGGDIVIDYNCFSLPMDFFEKVHEGHPNTKIFK